MFGCIFDAPRLQTQLTRLNQEITSPGFWNDSERSLQVSRERKRVESLLNAEKELAGRVEELSAYFQLLHESEDAELVGELRRELARLSSDLEQIELQTILGQENDSLNAIVTIHPGAGGTESQDWADMLLRMYLRWAERRGFSSSLNDRQEGDEAGIKSATFTVTGDYAYGLMQSETGVHRLVRISPFDQAKRRHT